MKKRWIILTGTALSLSLAACGAPGQASGGGDDGATDGTGEVDGRKITISEKDDAGDPSKAVATART